MSWMCIVLFSDDPPVNSAELARHYQASWPGSPPLGPAETKDNVTSFNVGGDWVLIGRMPAAIPDMQVEDQFAEMMWPGAQRDIERHRFHWIVTVGGNQGKEADKARLLTRFIHALLASHPTALGVTWGAHAHLVSSKVFQEGAISLRANEDPTHLWLTVRCGWRPEGAAAGKSAGMTRGLADFELMEIESVEAHESPTDLYDRLQGLAGYLIKRGPVIRDGDTVGADEDEKIKVVYSDSTFGAEGRVMRLVYGDAGAAGGRTPGPTFSAPAAPLAAAPVVATPVAASPFNASPAVGNSPTPNPFAATTGPAALPPNNTSWRPPGPGGPAPTSPPGAWTPPPAPNASGSWGAPGSAPAYGAPGVAGYPRPSTAPTSTSVLAIFSLICGIVAPFLLCLCFLSLPTSILAVVMGHIALSHIKHSGGKLTGRGAAIAGVILGYITLLLSVGFLLWIFVIAPNRNSSTFSTFPGADEIELDSDKSSGSGPAPPAFPKFEIPQPQFPKPELPKRALPESLEPAVPPGSPPPSSPTTGTPPTSTSPSTPPATSPSTDNPPKNDLPGASPFGAPPFPPFPGPRGPMFPEGIPGGPPGFPPIPGFPPTPGTTPTPGKTPSVPDPFAPAESTGRSTNRPGRGDRDPVDPSILEASLPKMTWPVKSIAFSPDGARLALGRLDAAILVFDMKTKQQIWQQERINSLGQASVMTIAPDGKTLIAGGQSGQLMVWNIDDADSSPRNLTPHTQPVTCIDMQSEGKFVITGGQDGKVIWQPPTQPEKSRTLAVYTSPVRAVRVGSPATTAWVTDGKEASQIDLRKSEVLRTVRLGGGGVLAAALSQDARFVAVSEGGKVKVWELETGKQLSVLDGRSELQWTVRFAPDGKSLLAGGRGKLLRWDFAKGELTKTLSIGGIQNIQTMAISSDSRFVATIVDSSGQTPYVLKLAD